MYSRSLGMTNNTQNEVEKFNQNLRAQYSQKKKSFNPSIQKETADAPDKTDEVRGSVSNFIESIESGIKSLDIKIDFETILIIGLILILLTDTASPDIVLLGILVSLIL